MGDQLNATVQEPSTSMALASPPRQSGTSTATSTSTAAIMGGSSSSTATTSIAVGPAASSHPALAPAPPAHLDNQLDGSNSNGQHQQTQHQQKQHSLPASQASTRTLIAVPIPIVSFKRAERLQIKRQFQELIQQQRNGQQAETSGSGSAAATTTAAAAAAASNKKWTKDANVLALQGFDEDEFVDALVDEYQRFMQLRLWIWKQQQQHQQRGDDEGLSPTATTSAAGVIVMPSFLVDLMWQAHMKAQNGSTYDRFCQRHAPILDDVDLDYIRYHDEVLAYLNDRWEQRKHRQILYATTLQQYQTAFGESPTNKSFKSDESNSDEDGYDDGDDDDGQGDDKANVTRGGILFWPPGVDDRPAGTSRDGIDTTEELKSFSDDEDDMEDEYVMDGNGRVSMERGVTGAGTQSASIPSDGDEQEMGWLEVEERRLAAHSTVFEGGQQRQPFQASRSISDILRLEGRRENDDMLPNAIHYLNRWAREHAHHPYPNEQEIAEIVRATGFTKHQVLRWFKNWRSRRWDPSLGGQSASSPGFPGKRSHDRQQRQSKAPSSPTKHSYQNAMGGSKRTTGNDIRPGLATVGAGTAAEGSSFKSDPELEPLVDPPCDNDVLYEKGGGSHIHPGNRRFLQLIEQHKEEFARGSEHQRSIVVSLTMATICKMDPPGRFLQRKGVVDVVDKDGQGPVVARWFGIGYNEARRRIHYAFSRRIQGSEMLDSSNTSKESGGKKDKESGGKKDEQPRASEEADSLVPTPTSDRDPTASSPQEDVAIPITTKKTGTRTVAESTCELNKAKTEEFEDVTLPKASTIGVPSDKDESESSKAKLSSAALSTTTVENSPQEKKASSNTRDLLSGTNDREKDMVKIKQIRATTNVLVQNNEVTRPTKTGPVETNPAVAAANVMPSLSFLSKLNAMLVAAEHEIQQYVSWMPSGRSFMVHRPVEFVDRVLPRFFPNHKSFNSFQRELNLNGFYPSVEGPESGAYQNCYFVRGTSDVNVVTDKVTDKKTMKNDETTINSINRNKDDLLVGSSASAPKSGVAATNCPLPPIGPATGSPTSLPIEANSSKANANPDSDVSQRKLTLMKSKGERQVNTSKPHSSTVVAKHSNGRADLDEKAAFISSTDVAEDASSSANAQTGLGHAGTECNRTWFERSSAVKGNFGHSVVSTVPMTADGRPCIHMEAATSAHGGTYTRTALTHQDYKTKIIAVSAAQLGAIGEGSEGLEKMGSAKDPVGRMDSTSQNVSVSTSTTAVMEKVDAGDLAKLLHSLDNVEVANGGTGKSADSVGCKDGALGANHEEKSQPEQNNDIEGSSVLTNSVQLLGKADIDTPVSKGGHDEQLDQGVSTIDHRSYVECAANCSTVASTAGNNNGEKAISLSSLQATEKLADLIDPPGTSFAVVRKEKAEDKPVPVRRKPPLTICQTAVHDSQNEDQRLNSGVFETPKAKATILEYEPATVASTAEGTDGNGNVFEEANSVEVVGEGLNTKPGETTTVIYDKKTLAIELSDKNRREKNVLGHVVENDMEAKEAHTKLALSSKAISSPLAPVIPSLHNADPDTLSNQGSRAEPVDDLPQAMGAHVPSVRLSRGSKVWLRAHIAILEEDWLEGDDVAKIKWEGYGSMAPEEYETSEMESVVDIGHRSSRRPIRSHDVIARKGQRVWVEHGHKKEESIAVLSKDWSMGDQKVLARWEDWQNRKSIAFNATHVRKCGGEEKRPSRRRSSTSIAPKATTTAEGKRKTVNEGNRRVRQKKITVDLAKSQEKSEEKDGKNPQQDSLEHQQPKPSSVSQSSAKTTAATSVLVNEKRLNNRDASSSISPCQQKGKEVEAFRESSSPDSSFPTMIDNAEAGKKPGAATIAKNTDESPSLILAQGGKVWIRHGPKNVEDIAILAGDWLHGDKFVLANWESFLRSPPSVFLASNVRKMVEDDNPPGRAALSRSRRLTWKTKQQGNFRQPSPHKPKPHPAPTNGIPTVACKKTPQDDTKRSYAIAPNPTKPEKPATTAHQSKKSSRTDTMGIDLSIQDESKTRSEYSEDSGADNCTSEEDRHRRGGRTRRPTLKAAQQGTLGDDDSDRNESSGVSKPDSEDGSTRKGSRVRRPTRKTAITPQPSGGIQDGILDKELSSVVEKRKQPNSMVVRNVRRKTGGFSSVLYRKADSNVLTEYQCLLRKQLLLFEATRVDVEASATPGRCGLIEEGQAGLRCRHCPTDSRITGAVYYSNTVDGFYQIAQNMGRLHLLQHCKRIPKNVKVAMQEAKSKQERTCAGKKYWAELIREMGCIEEGKKVWFRSDVDRHGPVPTEFPLKLYDLLEAAKTQKDDHIVSWLPEWPEEGGAFQVHDHDLFIERFLLPRFSYQKFETFSQQLMRYGFLYAKDGSWKGAWYHPVFKRGDRELCMSLSLSPIPLAIKPVCAFTEDTMESKPTALPLELMPETPKSKSGMYHHSSSLHDNNLPTIKAGMRLALTDDSDQLNQLHCFVRSKLLEVFVLDEHHGFRMGLRCVHCGTLPRKERVVNSMSVFFPRSLGDIYQGVITWQRCHFPGCSYIPAESRSTYERLRDQSSRGRKVHWVTSAKAMGFRDVDEARNGVVYHADLVEASGLSQETFDGSIFNFDPSMPFPPLSLGVDEDDAMEDSSSDDFLDMIDPHVDAFTEGLPFMRHDADDAGLVAVPAVDDSLLTMDFDEWPYLSHEAPAGDEVELLPMHHDRKAGEHSTIDMEATEKLAAFEHTEHASLLNANFEASIVSRNHAVVDDRHEMEKKPAAAMDASMEDTISPLPGLFVISRNSTDAAKAAPALPMAMAAKDSGMDNDPPGDPWKSVPNPLSSVAFVSTSADPPVKNQSATNNIDVVAVRRRDDAGVEASLLAGRFGGVPDPLAQSPALVDTSSSAASALHTVIAASTMMDLDQDPDLDEPDC